MISHHALHAGRTPRRLKLNRKWEKGSVALVEAARRLKEFRDGRLDFRKLNVLVPSDSGAASSRRVSSLTAAFRQLIIMSG